MAKLKMTQEELDACLFEACYQGHLNYAKVAMAAGANVNARGTDAAQRTPANYARLIGHTDIAAFLENAAKQQKGHAGRVTEERKDKGPPQVGG
jgi:ankyrin repeat protein